MDERVLTEHSGGPDPDSFPAVTGAEPAEAAAAGTPAAPATPAQDAGASPAPPAAAAPPPAEPAPPVAPAPPAAPASRWYQVPYAIVLAVVAAGLVWTWQGTAQVRAGMVTVAAGLLAAALARLVLPERRAGLLATRHRLFDVVILLGLGVCILVVALVLPRSALSPV